MYYQDHRNIFLRPGKECTNYLQENSYIFYTDNEKPKIDTHLNLTSFRQNSLAHARIDATVNCYLLLLLPL